mmetsp:Transcript_24881/g.80364  ORF Transcript_24881/g.80364 Transcript_24881/m.80364 type:complete len:268 (-) Transcript_24881:68-871(-)
MLRARTDSTARLSSRPASSRSATTPICAESPSSSTGARSSTGRPRPPPASSSCTPAPSTRCRPTSAPCSRRCNSGLRPSVRTRRCITASTWISRCRAQRAVRRRTPPPSTRQCTVSAPSVKRAASAGLWRLSWRSRIPGRAARRLLSGPSSACQQGRAGTNSSVNTPSDSPERTPPWSAPPSACWRAGPGLRVNRTSRRSLAPPFASRARFGPRSWRPPAPCSTLWPRAGWAAQCCCATRASSRSEPLRRLVPPSSAWPPPPSPPLL